MSSLVFNWETIIVLRYFQLLLKPTPVQWVPWYLIGKQSTCFVLLAVIETNTTAKVFDSKVQLGSVALYAFGHGRGNGCFYIAPMRWHKDAHNSKVNYSVELFCSLISIFSGMILCVLDNLVSRLLNSSWIHYDLRSTSSYILMCGPAMAAYGSLDSITKIMLIHRDFKSTYSYIYSYIVILGGWLLSVFYIVVKDWGLIVFEYIM
jgi:hypothetical protein